MRIFKRIKRLVDDKNRLMIADMLVQLGMGLLFSIMIYGFLFILSFFLFGVSVNVFRKNLGISPGLLSLIIVGIYFAVASVSAYRNVDPFRGIKKMTDQQWTMMMISQVTPNFMYFSPRHTTAAFATLLMGGPINFFTAWGSWKNRLSVKDDIIEEAANILKKSQKNLLVTDVSSPEAAVLLRQLGLIKVVDSYDGQVLKPTEKGIQLFAKRKG